MTSLYLLEQFGLNREFQLFLAQNCQLNKSFPSSQFSVTESAFSSEKVIS